MKESKKMSTLLKSVMLPAKGPREPRRLLPGGPKTGEGKTLKRLHNNGSQKDSYDSKNKEDPK